MRKLMRSAWLSLGFVVLAVASCDFPRLSTLTGDAGTSDADASVATQCTPVPGLVDDFNGAMNTVLWGTIQDSNVGVSQPGRLEIALAPNQAGAAYGGYFTRDDQDFREHCVYVTFVTVPTAPSDMAIEFTATTSVGFNVSDGQLVVYYKRDNYTPITSVPYDPVAHHVLRLRETGRMLFWETSSDGTTFASIYSEPDRIGIDLSSIGIRIYAGTLAAQANPGTAVFDDFDTP